MVRIGITTSFQDGEQRLHHAYVTAVERAGAVPVPVPMLETPAAVDAFADGLDGLVITGGPAVDDALEGSLADELSPLDATRRRADRALLDAFDRRPRPILGICYGMQLLNVRAGGTLYGDVEHQHNGARVHSQKRGGDVHPIACEPGTHLARLLGLNELEVNTRHLQAVASVAPDYRVAARAPDGVIEAIESKDGRVVAVQFHPERMGSSMRPLFRHLVERAEPTIRRSEPMKYAL